MSNNETDFFDGDGGTGAPSALLKNEGDFVHGTIVEMFKKENIPYGKKEPAKNPDGSTQMKLVVILQTDSRNWAKVTKVPKVDYSDPDSPEQAPDKDTGLRAVHIPENKNIKFAVSKAIQAAGGNFRVGGVLGVKVDSFKDTDKGDYMKDHKAVYTPPSAGGDFFPQQSAPAQAAAPTPPQAAPAAAPPAQQAPAAPPQQDPWATQAPSTPAAQDPWATPAPASSAPPF